MTQLFNRAKLDITTKGLFEIRPIFRSDLATFECDLGNTVDELYPEGRARMMRRLTDSVDSGTGAYVAVLSSNPNIPLALSSEISKGVRRLKMSTFWVSSEWRRKGLGSLLLDQRIQSWLDSDVEAAHVTVRKGRDEALYSLFSKFGFRHAATELSRYGEGEDEVVFSWRPEWVTRHVPTSSDSTLSRSSHTA